MLLLVGGFVIVLLVSFGLVIFVTMPSKDDQLIDQRLASIQAYDASEMTLSSASQLMKEAPASESKWAAAIVRKLKMAQKISLLIAQSNVRTSVSQVLLAISGLLVLGFLGTYLFIPLFAAAALVAVFVSTIPIIFLSWKRSRRLKAFDAELSNCIDMMSNALRAGHSVVGAIGILAEQAVEPAGTEFREVFAQQNFGLPLREALIEMLDRVPSADLRVVVTAILVQRDTGGNLGEILDRTVFVIRERVRIQGEIRTQTAQGRITGWVLTMLPVIMLFAINLINPGYSTILLKDPFGQKLIYVGIGLLFVGAMSIRHIINKIEV